jgi:trk system potassium uptake protein TrkA
MQKQIAVIGLGLFGTSVARTLAEKGAEVIAIDTSKEVVQKISDVVSHAVALDATDPQALVAAGVKDVDTAVIAVGDRIEASILTTAIVKNLGVPRIIARALNHLHAQILREIGADEVVFPEQDIGVRLAQTILGRNLLEYISLSEDYVVAEVTASEHWIGKALNEIRFRNTLGVSVVAMRRDGGMGGGKGARGDEKGKEEDRDAKKRKPHKHYFIPDPEETIQEGDVLVLAGRRSRVAKLIER